MSQATYQLMALRVGFHGLQLKDSFNEALELAKLLVNIKVCVTRLYTLFPGQPPVFKFLTMI